jgi:hypothetical protein
LSKNSAADRNDFDVIDLTPSLFQINQQIMIANSIFSMELFSR